MVQLMNIYTLVCVIQSSSNEAEIGWNVWSHTPPMWYWLYWVDWYHWLVACVGCENLVWMNCMVLYFDWFMWSQVCQLLKNKWKRAKSCMSVWNWVWGSWITMSLPLSFMILVLIKCIQLGVLGANFKCCWCTLYNPTKTWFFNFNDMSMLSMSCLTYVHVVAPLLSSWTLICRWWMVDGGLVVLVFLTGNWREKACTLGEIESVPWQRINKQIGKQNILPTIKVDPNSISYILSGKNYFEWKKCIFKN